MIVFYAKAGWKLNLTNLKITFIEENALFYDAFFRNYTPPFSLPMDDETSIKLGLIDDENRSDYTIKYEGDIFKDNRFSPGYLIIEVLEDGVEATLSFGKMTIPLMDTPLSSLPFPIIKSIYSAIVNNGNDKVYPDVSHCFPMIFDDKFAEETNYEAFEGIVNNFNGSSFVTNYIDGGTGDVINKNIIVPFPFLMEILKVGFASANMQMIGEFTNVKANNHIIIDPKKHLEKFSSNTFENYQFSQTKDEYLDGNTTIFEYEKTHFINTIGSFSLKAFLNFPPEVVVRDLVISKDGVELFSKSGNSVDETITINKEAISPTEEIKINLKIEATPVNVDLYNNFVFEKSEGKLNVFKSTFSLAEFMPDMTFGQLLTKVKNNQNLKVVLSNAYVRMDYVENVFTQVDFKDETAFEMKKPKRVPNKNKLYKLQYSEDNFLLINKDGLTSSTATYRDEDIITIDMQLQLLPIENREGIFSAVRTEKELFTILLYGGTDLNGYPVVVEKVEGLTFKLPEVYDMRWKNWLNFRTNSETVTDKFTAHSLEEFLVNEGRFKYNKKHIYKTIKRIRESEDDWKYEIESETLG